MWKQRRYFYLKNTKVKINTNIDTRYHLIRQYINDGIIEIEFIQKKNNKYYIITKNLEKEKHHIKCEYIINKVNE